MSKGKNKPKKASKKPVQNQASKPAKKESGDQEILTTKNLQQTAKTEPLAPKPEVKPKTTQATTATKTESVWQKPDFRRKFLATFWGIIGVAAVVGVVFIGFPQLFDQTEAAQDYQAEKEEEQRLAEEADKRQEREEAENPFIEGTNRRVSLTTSFGEIVIETQTEAAPQSVENFLRLVYRDYYNQTTFHRMVEQENFAVIQGGDPTGTGSGGESAFGPTETVPDELWKVEPEFEVNENGETVLANEPELQGEGLYKDFDTETGFVVYPKGSVVMAKTSAPDSATSQFFITLKDTSLPAQYTVFGKVIEEDFEVLDKISQEVDPVPQQNVDGTMGTPGDGQPSKEIRIEEAEILPA